VESGTWRERYRAWKWSLTKQQRTAHEHLLPRIVRDIRRESPTYTETVVGHLDQSTDELAAEVAALTPWLVPFDLGRDVTTMPRTPATAVTEQAYLFRRDLITGTLADVLGDELGDTTVLDIGCNCGYFSLDLADRGVRSVRGVDLRANNIAQANFLAEHFGVDGVTFEVRDSRELEGVEQFDVVLNLGLLYHVTEPFELVRQTYELCRRMAIIDTSCALEPFAGFVIVGDRDVGKPVEGRADVELHPTYRGAIETIRAAGFSEVFEVIGRSDRPHPRYDSGMRRCFLAIK
jgi:2-polyprenyl-3-methyl-5-hydroxy-6-metoxy-1,4-benzoquinol methylase